MPKAADFGGLLQKICVTFTTLNCEVSLINCWLSAVAINNLTLILLLLCLLYCTLI